MNISRITSITPDGTYDSPHGLLYQQVIVFEDGTVGQSNAKKSPPPYRVGDEVGYDITGQYPGGNKLKITAKPYGAQGAPQGARPPLPTPPPRQTAPAGQGAASAPPSHAPINGQTVGMAMKEALTLHHPSGYAVSDPKFWEQVYQTASDIIRLSQLLEKGKLALPVRERSNPATEPQGGRSDPPKGPAPKPGPGGSVELDQEDLDGPVPF